MFFHFVALAGYIQAWVFSGKDMGLPKPPFYDLLNPFPFWPLWMMLILPLAFLKGPGWIFWPAQFIYFYFLASLIVFLFNKILKKQ